MDIYKVMSNFISSAESYLTNGMTDSELKAYKMGTEDTLNLLKDLLENPNAIINIKGIGMKEYTLEELPKILLQQNPEYDLI